MLNWEIEFYQTSTGNKPIEEFIDSLEKKTQLKIAHAIDLLQEFGLRIGYPQIKKVTGTDLWELRILGSDNIRIFYIAINNKTFLLLHGFRKKKQKTPDREIRLALGRLKEYRMR
nr:type II toxin-antitoxin system RelE/ParE family toxin [Candidatus Levybacteria bacterium]